MPLNLIVPSHSKISLFPKVTWEYLYIHLTLLPSLSDTSVKIGLVRLPPESWWS